MYISCADCEQYGSYVIQRSAILTRIVSQTLIRPVLVARKFFLRDGQTTSLALVTMALRCAPPINFHYNADDSSWLSETTSQETETRPADVDFLPLVSCCLARGFVFGPRSVTLLPFPTAQENLLLVPRRSESRDSEMISRNASNSTSCGNYAANIIFARRSRVRNFQSASLAIRNINIQTFPFQTNVKIRIANDVKVRHLFYKWRAIAVCQPV